MGRGNKSKLSGKTVDPETIDPQVRHRMQSAAGETGLACAVAMVLAQELSISPETLGRYADALGIRLTKCQLGLFGYSPKKKIVTPELPDNRALQTALSSSCADNRLPCRTAWDVAAQFELPRLAVSGACEAMGIKISPCQLGAF